MTHRTGLIEFLQYRNPMKKVKRSWKLPIAYFVFNAFSYTIGFLFIIPLWKNWMEIWVLLATLAVATLFWIISINRDPGFIKPHPKVDFLVSASIIFTKFKDQDLILRYLSSIFY